MVGWGMAVLCWWVSCGAMAGQLEYSVWEETEPGVAVGNIASDLKLSAVSLSLRNFRFLSSYSEPYFEVDLGSGSLVVREPADRERLCGAKAACILTYELMFDDPLELHKIRVHLLDTNDNSPLFPAGDMHLHIPEFLTPGARFTLPNAQDADEGSNGLISYSLSSSQHFRLDMGSRADGSKYPELVLEKVLDREQRDTHLLVLTAQDGGLPARSGDAQVTITVVDTNDNVPVFEHSIYSTRVPETAPNGTVLFHVQASDPDEGSNGDVWYSLSNSTPAEMRHLFHIHPQSGEVQVAASLGPPETLLEAYVEARDKGTFSLASTTKLLVEVTDVNDHAPQMDFMTFSSPVPEDAAPGTVIALLSVKDEDLGSNGEVTCSLSSKGPFRLKASFDSYYRLLTDGPLDREQASEYQVLITASDGGSPPLSTRRTLTVSVADVNDNTPSFPQSQQELFVDENNSPGVSLGRMFAQDPDLGENGLVFYELLDIISEGMPLSSSLVAVEPTSGVITARTSFDFEQLRGFHFQVEGRDGGIPPRSATVTVNLFVVDRNDNAPAILFPLPRNGSIPVERVPRSARAGHLVTKVVAEDADSGSNAWLSYHISQASDSSLFRISVSMGELRIARLVFPTDAVKQRVVVVVQDHGEPPLSSSVTLGVLLSNSVPQVFPDFEDIWEPRAQLSVRNLYLVIALVCISFLFLGCLLFFVCIKLSQSPDCCSQNCCHSPENTRHERTMASSPWVTSATIDVTTIERLSQTYLYQTSLGLGSGSNSLLLHGKYNAAELRNLATGAGLNLPISCAQIRNRKDPTNLNAMPRQPNPDWRYSASLRAGMHSSVHLEEAGILRAGPGGPDQQWPTVSSATPEPEAGEVSPPVGAGVNSNSWTFKYGPGNPKQSGPGELPDKFIIPGSPAIISIRQEPANNQIDKSDFITFGKKEETKKKKKKKKGNKAQEKKEKGNSTTDNSDQ
ncbi:protocadherin alpha-C1 isoform X3 [Onychomys torridus]|uniref:protocadherin alpha-C1 isoform X3 n=1 Tax=Onychomys torridus TaxID=38674 RepID=UPI00167FC8D9|nr:protocadherin alpha-C1 isoform X3 [Onychomys torridus]